jgi:hypothetical protein
MTEAHACTELDQAGLRGSDPGVRWDTEALGRPPQHVHVAERLDRSDQEEPPGLDRKRFESSEEPLLDPTGHGYGFR